jgi:GT2 family glycosyltransferase
MSVALMNDVDVSNAADAVVVAYRSGEVIGECVQSLVKDPAVHRVVVVNNSAGDSTEAEIEGLTQAIYLPSAANVGFGRAVNSARPHIARDYVVLANPDTRQSHSTVGQAVRFLEEHPAAALVGPRMVHPDGSVYRNSQHALTLSRMIAERVGWPNQLRIQRTIAEHGVPHVTDYVIGSFMVLRRAALDSVGWFDENIFLFGEDQDLCRRLRRAGWEVWYAPVGQVVHAGGHSWRQLSDRGRHSFRQARRRELRADSGRLAALLYSSLEMISHARRR